MTLQTAAQQALKTLESGALLCELTAASMLRVALADEQAQAVKPVAWWIPKAEQFCLPPLLGERPFAKAWEPLYTHPAPSVTETLAAHGVKLRTEFEPKPRDHVEDALAMVGKREELIAGLIRKSDAWDYLHPEAKRPNVCREAANMLEADAAHMALSDLAGNAETMSIANSQIKKLKTQLAQRTVERDMVIRMAAEGSEIYGNEAQQVAVPMPMSADQAMALWHTLPDDGGSFPDFLEAVKAVEAHHKIGVKLVTKPDSLQKTDWSAA